MRQKTHHLYHLFYPRNWIIIFLLLFSALAIAQEQTPPPEEFHIGAKIGKDPQQEDSTLNSYFECGFNGIWWEAYPDVKVWLDEKNLELLAENGRSREDYVYHYATGYYSKWEAEQNQEDNRVGIKHGTGQGQFANWNGAQCWSTVGLTAPACSLIYGPHYRQEKRYKRWYEDPNYDRFALDYTVRFRMAINYDTNLVSRDEDVCVIKVVYRYAKVYSPTYWTLHDTVFRQRTLKVQDFLTGGEFSYLDLPTYRYPEIYRPEEIGERDFRDKLELPPPIAVTYNDTEAGLGIQFWVDWLRTDNHCTLYVDNIEVYDNDGWNRFIDFPAQTIGQIRHYADSVSSEYDYLKYFYVHDEPYTIDAFIPYHTVEQIVMDTTGIPLITEFYPYWTHDGKINGEDFLQQWYDIGQPEKLMIDFYPFSPEYEFRFRDAEELRLRLQKCSELQPGFWYSAQGFGVWSVVKNDWDVWRFPTSEEFNSTIMLGLAHGMQGIELFSYTSFGNDVETITKGIVENRTTEPFARTHLWYHLKDKLIPRLKGKLGNTLMSLDYTGEYINIEYQEQPPPGDNEHDYLSIQHYGMSYFWHAGFFEHKSFPENKHFLLTNLRTNYAVESKLIVSNNTNYQNISFTDIEAGVGRVDTTINYNSSIEYFEEMPAGEGRLYRVAPVVKYGGRLLYSESTQPGMILYDDMVIESGAVLTINGVYSSKGNITLKSGGIINGSNGKIQFVDGKKLIIEGSGSITGTVNSKLELVFSEPINDDPTGILTKANSSLTISNCKIENATIGINSLVNATYLNAQNVDFINCETHSINMAGRNPGMNPLPPPQIKNCTMTNSLYGIWITNLPGMLIQDNTITNTDCGIFLSSVTDAQVINNQIHTDTELMEGIFATSTGGAIRGNYISGHTVGIRLANSSPEVGGNDITDCLYHGMYIATGSNPNMVGNLVLNLGTREWYATSGYNKIYDNGGYSGPGADNDGSEIYFYNSNSRMRAGCNSIYDNRQPSPLLINTLLLMNGYSTGLPLVIQAQYNFWGDTVYAARFGSNLIVNYIPYYLDECPWPDGSGSEDELVLKTQFGDVIDTVYSTGAEVPELTETEEAYADAEGYFLTGDLTNALQGYEGIINSNATEEEKYLAYQRKYSIGKLTGQSTEYFNQLSNTFAILASYTQDSLNLKILTQLSTLSKVGEQEYETAIGEFDVVIQQNPETEEAVYAEIDALTTSLLIEESDSTLNKGRLGKYLVKTSGDYNKRVDEILRKNFGSQSKETEEELLPTEYTLYQNYPNPFNPTTTIKYDLPFASEVSVVIYDILGRKVKELVNTKQQAGRYEVQFNASNLASGVYIYQLVAEKYMQSRKMILLK